MSHIDFFIRKEHKFIKTILGEDEVKQSAALKSVSNYIEVFLKFTEVFILLENNIQRLTDFEDIVDQYLKNFYQNNCRKFDTFPEILEEVKKFEVKRIGKKMSKLTLQIMGFAYTRMIMSFVYTRMMDFKKSDFLISAFVCTKFFEGLRHLTIVKLHLHHSRVNGKIHGYTHGFCNLNFAHNFFGFDFSFVVRGMRLAVWKSKELNVGGCNLTNINFANLGNVIKFIDTVKY